MALTYHFTTTTGAPVASLVSGGAGSVFYGLAATSAEASTIFLKIYWEGTGTLPPSQPFGAQPATTGPVVGTTRPNLTIPIPTSGLFNLSFDPVNNGGRLWYWVTAAAGDLDATALTAGGDVITLIYG